MLAEHTSLRARARDFLALDDDWERPPPTRHHRRVDLGIAALFAALFVITLELVRAMGALEDLSQPVWLQYLALVPGAIPLIWRRRYPLVVAAVTQAHFVLVGVLTPQIAYQLTVQVFCFFGLYTGVAWARNRRAMLGLYGAVLVVMFGWLTWDLALGSAIDEILRRTQGRPNTGLLGPVAADVVYAVLINVIFFGGVLAGGQASWRSARHLAVLRRQAATIEQQTAELREQALIDERLRIARELHDVVAHHVSVIGVQAAAARRVLPTRPQAAAEALGHAEEASR